MQRRRVKEMTDKFHTIEYRRLVASVASQLSVEEVERIVFVRSLESDLTAKSTSALNLLAALECKGEFSLQNVDGLLEIVKDVNRYDLMEQIESYKKSRALAKKSVGKGKVWKSVRTKQLSSDEERRHLEETFEMMVTRFTFLEQQMSLIPRVLEGEGDIQDEGTMVLRSLKHAADELAFKLGKTYEYFVSNREGDGRESPQGSMKNMRRGRGSYDDKMVNHVELKIPPGLRADQVTQQYSKVLKQLLVRPPITSVGSSSSACKTSPESGELPIHGVIGRDEDQDFTGDSGFSMASRYYDDHDPYCVVDLWRRHSGDNKSAIGKRAHSDVDHGYMSVNQSSMNIDSTYATCTVNKDNIKT